MLPPRSSTSRALCRRLVDVEDTRRGCQLLAVAVRDLHRDAGLTLNLVIARHIHLEEALSAVVRAHLLHIGAVAVVPLDRHLTGPIVGGRLADDLDILVATLDR